MASRLPGGVEGDEADWAVTRHMRRVYALAARYRRMLPWHVEFDDIAAAGMLGLVEARDRFVRSFKVAFSTYAEYRIRGAILDFIREQGRTACVRPMDFSRCAHPEEGEESEGSAVQALEDPELLRSSSPWLSLRFSGCPYQSFLELELNARLSAAVAVLPPRERLVVSLYYFDQRRMREIGEVLGLDRSRVSQLRASGIARLRRKLAKLRPAIPPKPGSCALCGPVFGARRG